MKCDEQRQKREGKKKEQQRGAKGRSNACRHRSQQLSLRARDRWQTAFVREEKRERMDAREREALFRLYSEREQMSATPLRHQWTGGSLVGKRMAKTKFVEWPVVDSVPLLAVVRYTGQT